MMSPLDTASSLLWWSNVLYVVGALLTLGTSAMVLFEKRQAGKGIEVKHSVRNEVFFVSSALICLAGTCGAIYFSSKVSNIKDADLAAYKVSAGLQIAQANNAAEQAKAVAATASNNVAGANKKAAEANSTAQLAVLDKTKILHDNLALQQKIEAEQSARVVIENKIAPRTLAPGQQQNIMYALHEKLKAFDQKHLDLVYPPNDPEAENLDVSIGACFQGWTIYPFLPSWGLRSGIYIEFDPQNASAKREAEILVTAFRENGLSVSDAVGDLPNQIPEPFIAKVNHRQSDAPLRITIGPK